MIRKTIVRTITLVALTGFMTACNHEDYEEGEGSLSYLYADYADITIAGGEVISIITDDNAQLTLPQNLMVSEQLPPDTMLRRLIHYITIRRACQNTTHRRCSLVYPLTNWTTLSRSQIP